MPRFAYRSFEAVPAAAEAPLREVAPLLGERPRLFSPPHAQAYWFGRTDRHFAYLAGDAGARRRVLLEVRRLDWAREQGLRVPPMVAHAPDGSWLVSELVPSDGPVGPGYVLAAAEAARALAALPSPPPDVLEGSYGRRAPRRGRLRRVARLLAGGVNVREFAGLRRAAASLAADTVTHGDFHPNNVLYDEAAGAVTLTDFEMLGLAPAGSDLLLLWVTLDRDEDRELILDELLRDAGAEERRRLSIVHRWIAIRTLAERVALPRSERDREGIEEARRLLALARENARVWSPA